MPNKSLVGRRSNPCVYEINARVWLYQLQEKYGSQLTLLSIPDDEWLSIRHMGFDFIWLMGVWKTGVRGRQIARAHEGLQKDYSKALPHWKDEDVIGSPYAIAAYQLTESLGTSDDLREVKVKLNRIGLGLILDFVPNHTATDHHWVREHPEYYVCGEESDFKANPALFLGSADQGRGVAKGPERLVAHGKDPWFEPWTDTAQLNYFSDATRKMVTAALLDIAEQCDGLRCDMAMLLLNDEHFKTWRHVSRFAKQEIPRHEFWTEAISRVRETHPNFLFLAEVYWGLEHKLCSLGFDYAYDKALYDRLKHCGASELKTYVNSLGSQIGKRAHFIENHDEERSLIAFGEQKSIAAAVASYTVPGLRLFYEGQFEGRRIRLPVQLRRAPAEPVNSRMVAFYERLLESLDCSTYHDGAFSPLNCRAVGEGDQTFGNFVAWSWENGIHVKVVVLNYSETRSYARIFMPFIDEKCETITLRDELNDVVYEREVGELRAEGLFVALEPWSAHMFEYIKGGAARDRVPVDVVAGVLADEKGRILVCRRAAHKTNGGFWEFPGGKVEKDESHADALEREFIEELGFKIRAGRHIVTVEHRYPHGVVRLHSYYVTVAEGAPQCLEHAEIGFVDPKDFGNLTFAAANMATVSKLMRYAALL